MVWILFVTGGLLKARQCLLGKVPVSSSGMLDKLKFFYSECNWLWCRLCSTKVYNKRSSCSLFKVQYCQPESSGNFLAYTPGRSTTCLPIVGCHCVVPGVIQCMNVVFRAFSFSMEDNKETRSITVQLWFK